MAAVATLATDVAVLGGGPSGCATALSLARSGYLVVLIERSEYQSYRPGETLPPEIREPLVTLGVWTRFLADNHSPSFGIHSAWSQDCLCRNDFIFNPYGPGWHVDRQRFDAMLSHAAEDAGVLVCRGGQRTRVTEGAAGLWHITVAGADEPRSWRSRFVVDATGRVAAFARAQGATRISYDQLVGLVRFLSGKDAEGNRGSHTVVEALEDGWWYRAPCPTARCVLAYMTDADLYARGLEQSTTYWHDRLQRAQHTLSGLANHALEPEPLVFSANSSLLDRIAGWNWLAAGDAAAAFDPLSSQGVYRALSSGILAAKSLHQSWAGNKRALEHYVTDVCDNFATYLAQRDLLYSQESRWSNSTFWQRRATSRQKLLARLSIRFVRATQQEGML